MISQNDIDGMFKWAVKHNALEILKHFLNKGVSEVVFYTGLDDSSGEVREFLKQYKFEKYSKVDKRLEDESS